MNFPKRLNRMSLLDEALDDSFLAEVDALEARHVIVRSPLQPLAAAAAAAPAAASGGLGLGPGANAFATAAAFTLVRTVSLQLFLAGTTAYIGSTADDPETALAAHLVLKQFYLVLSFATDALAVAAQQLVASADSTRRAREVATRLLLWGLVVGVAFAAVLFVVPPQILTTDPNVAAEAKDELLRVVAPLQVLSSLVFVGDGILQGTRDFTFEAYAVSAASLLAGSSLFIRHDDALSAAWDAIAVLNGLRFLAFAYRYLVRGPLLAGAAPDEAPLAGDDDGGGGAP